jgi:hypothetical protein
MVGKGRRGGPVKQVILPRDEQSQLLTNREFDIVRLVARGFVK